LPNLLGVGVKVFIKDKKLEMPNIRRLSNFLNEGIGLTPINRQELIDYIINNISKSTDTYLMQAAEDLGISLRSIGNNKLITSFYGMDPYYLE